jgi:hypothetical protein
MLTLEKLSCRIELLTTATTCELALFPSGQCASSRIGSQSRARIDAQKRILGCGM